MKCVSTCDFSIIPIAYTNGPNIMTHADVSSGASSITFLYEYSFVVMGEHKPMSNGKFAFVAQLPYSSQVFT